MKQRRRIYYSAAQRAEIWDRWKAGESMSSIGRRFDRESSSVFSVLSPTGGIRPPDRKRADGALIHAVAARPAPGPPVAAVQDVEGLAEQQLIDSLAPIRPEIGHGDPAMHGLDRTIGRRAHQPFQRLFGEVGAGQKLAGRDQVEDVGQTWARMD